MKEEQKINLKDQTEEKSKVEIVKKEMGRRTPLYKQNALGIQVEEGWIPYQVLEKPGEVERFLRAGYIPCNEKDISLRDQRVQHDHALGTVIREVVNRRPGASSATAIWMKIRKEDYYEDQQAKAKLNDERAADWNPKNIVKSNPDIYYSGDLDFKQNKFNNK
jgi:hypothetical protein